MPIIGNAPPAMPGQPPMGAPGVPPAPMPAPPPMGAPPPTSGLFLLLAFLAGAGLDKTAGAVERIKKTMSGQMDSGAARAHRGGVRLDAANNPGMTIAPQMAQMLAAKASQQPSGSDDLTGLLSRALLMNAGPKGIA